MEQQQQAPQAAPQKARDPLADIMNMDIDSMMPDLSGVNDVMNMDIDSLTRAPGMDEIERILRGD